MHRWIVENDYGDPLIVGDTTIAKYWPGLYVNVRTWRVDRENTAARAVWALKTGSDFKDAERLMPNQFVTRVYRCDKHGLTASFRRSGVKPPLFEREYATLEEAKAGHKEAVRRFS
jgi:hypothetical protein